MYIDTSTTRRNQKTYTRYLLRESFRENGKVKHRTIANLSACSPEEISAIKLAFAHKHDVKGLREKLSPDNLTIEVKQGTSVGSVWLLKSLAKELGFEKALGSSSSGKLALWQIIARALEQGSRLSAVRAASRYGACDILDLDDFDEEDLYKNLGWLSENQSKIEERLFRLLPQQALNLFLYDVTSSYFEGTCNELATFGYNRDGKRGKQQIVIGLLCNSDGVPLSVQVFEGNTQDPKTLSEQLRKTAQRFGVKEITWVGDRGMIKGAQIKQITEEGFHYITAITKPQIETLRKRNIIQLDLFDQELVEVNETEENVRYVLRRNPTRATEIAATRVSKWQKLERLVNEKNNYLAQHPKARVETAVHKIQQKAAQLKIAAWATIALQDRLITITSNEEIKQRAAELDGCYVIKTDLPAETISKEIIHERYKDLALVEQAFRSSKTAHLELRPIYVRNAARTRGHVFVVMLAYRLIKELRKRWQLLEATVEEGLTALGTLTSTEVTVNNTHRFNQIPIPNAMNHALLKAANVRLPTVIAAKGVTVATRKKLVSERKVQ